MNAGWNVTIEDDQGLELWGICWANGRCSHRGNGSGATDDLTADGSLTRRLHNTSRSKVPIRADEAGGWRNLWFRGDLCQRTRQRRNSVATFVSFVVDDLCANGVTECGIHQLE